MKSASKGQEIENQSRRETFLSSRLFKWSGAILFLIAILILLGLSSGYVEMPRWDIDRVLHPVRDLGSVPFFAASVVLPLAAFPMTPFYLLGGATFGVWFSIIATGIAQALHLTLSYWIAAYFLRGFLERLVRRASYSIPAVKPENYLKFTLLVKMTPGPPGFLKNYIIALAHVPFKIYLLVTWPVAMAYAVGVILLGDSIMDGNLKQALVAVALVIFFLLALRFVRHRTVER